MGWSGATGIFDSTTKAVLDSSATEGEKAHIIKSLLSELVDADWDTECESSYFTHPLVKKAFISFDKYYEKRYEEIEKQEIK